MYRIFYAEKDNTLYERFSEQNAGIDEIIELSKIASGSRVNGVIRDNTYNSRMLVDFGSAITTIKIYNSSFNRNSNFDYGSRKKGFC